MRERSWSVWFGSVPSYRDDVEGFEIEGTSAGSPAEKAGLLKGDVIVQIGDIPIAGMSDFLYMLQVYKPGDVVLTRFLRDGKPHEVRITLATRAAE
jgi:S1-C subfamily serine protease